MKYTFIIMLVLILASCGGGGSSSTTYSEVCGTCNGYGVIVDQATGYKRVCPSCGNPCTACGGFGLATDYYGNVGNCVYCAELDAIRTTTVMAPMLVLGAVPAHPTNPVGRVYGC